MLPALTVAAGDALVAIVTCGGSAGEISGIRDTQSNVWSKAAADANGTTVEIELWYALNCAGGATTVTVSLSSTMNINAAVAEWSGMAASAALELVGAAATGNSAAPATGGITIANGGDLVVGGAGESSAETVSSGPNNGFIPIVNIAQGPTLMAAYLTPGAVGTYATGWTTSTAHPWVGVLAAFKAAAGTQISAGAASAAGASGGAGAAMQASTAVAAGRDAQSGVRAAMRAITISASAARASGGAQAALRAAGARISAGAASAAGASGGARAAMRAIAAVISAGAYATGALMAAATWVAGTAVGISGSADAARDQIAAAVAAGATAPGAALATNVSIAAALSPTPVVGIGIAIDLADAVSPIEVSLALAVAPVDVELTQVMEL